MNTQGATLDEARDNLREALAMVLEANRKLARRDEPPDSIREPLALSTRSGPIWSVISGNMAVSS